jgi:hypothetical protein
VVCGAHGRGPRLVVQQGDLAEAVTGAERPDEATVLDHVHLTGAHDVEVVAALALVEHRPPGLDVGVLERPGELLDRRDREGTEHRHRAQGLDVGVAHAHRPVEPFQCGPPGQHRERREQADRHEAEADAEQLHDERRHQAPGRPAQGQDRLEAGEHPREHGLVGQPRQQREARDVDQRVADADDREERATRTRTRRTRRPAR